MATGRIGTTPVLTTRWSKAPAAGTTSLSGLDDNSVSLVYSVGYEAVYQNGVLLSRGNDYTATNGTTITLTTATVAGDIIEVFANQTIPLTDTYSQTVSDGRFIKNTLTTTTGDIIYASAANTPARLAIGSTDQVLKVSGGIPAWGAAPAASFVGCSIYNSSTTFANNTATALDFDTEEFDTDAFHSTTTNKSRMTIPSGKAGKYLVIGRISFAANATGLRQARINKNGNIQALSSMSAFAGGGNNITVSGIFNTSVGDYLDLVAYQTSGGTLGQDSTNAYDSSFYIQFLGA
jgi:hypothetical protein